jgi:hypothetical protein
VGDESSILCRTWFIIPIAMWPVNIYRTMDLSACVTRLITV